MKAYAGGAESRKSGCDLWSSIPQKGHKGFVGISMTEDSVKYLITRHCKGVSGRNLEARLQQHLQNHRGVAGQTCMETAHLAILWFWTVLSVVLEH
jgi:hypothetical protein